MYGDTCPKCHYSSHDENGTDYHNDCLKEMHEEELKYYFLLGSLITFFVIKLLNFLRK